MITTLEQLIHAGYDVPAAAPDAWRSYDEQDPLPGYFEFDWLSSRHPDLYHRFALSTVGLMDELDRLVDLTGLGVVDVAAGTGRSAAASACWPPRWWPPARARWAWPTGWRCP